MAEHDLRAVAFPTLNEAQIEKLGSCAGAFLKKYPDGTNALQGRRARLQVFRRQVR